MPELLVPIADLKLHLGGEIDATEDDVLCWMEQGAVEWLEGVTGRQLEGVETIQYLHSGKGGNRIWLNDDPVTFTKIEARDAVDLDTFTEVVSTDYYTQGRELVRLSGVDNLLGFVGAVWAKGFYNYRITYEAGYTSATVPADIAMWIRGVINILWQKKQTGDLKREKIGDYEYEVADAAGQLERTSGIPLMSIVGKYQTKVATQGMFS